MKRKPDKQETFTSDQHFWENTKLTLSYSLIIMKGKMHLTKGCSPFCFKSEFQIYLDQSPSVSVTSDLVLVLVTLKISVSSSNFKNDYFESFEPLLECMSGNQV